MRTALQQSRNREMLGTVQGAHAPAPVGGWNTRDSLAEMQGNEASVLENWFPRASEVIQRGGSIDWCVGMTGAVRSLFDFSPTNAPGKLFAVTDAGIYEVTAGGLSNIVAQALTNGYVSTVAITNTGGTSFRFLCNGTDLPKLYDGTTWTTPAITGIASAASLVHCWLSKHRIFFIENTSMNAYYLSIDSIQGPLGKLPLGNLFHRGGFLMSGVSWTLDGGDGPDDYWCVVTSEGEIAVYSGTDPTSASAWGLVGVYFVGRPLGRRCFVKIGGDVGVLTENGLFPLSKILTSGAVNFATAYSNIIQPTWTNGIAIRGLVNVLGYEACVYPAWDACLVNFVGTGTYGAFQQLVMNTVTGKWCNFLGWQPRCFWVFQGDLYFGMAGGKVLKAWDSEQTLLNDNGTDITTTVHTAYNYFGSVSRLKKLALFRMLLSYSGAIDTRWGISSDFADAVMSSFVPRNASTTAAGSAWDTSIWNVSPWSQDMQRYKIWRSSAHVPGYALSLWLQTIGNSGTLSWAGSDFLLDGGDYL